MARRRILALALLFAGALLSSSCSSSGKGAGGGDPAADERVPIDSTSVDLAPHGAGFYLQCPYGLACDATYDNRAFVYDEPRFAFGLIFDGVVAAGYSLESFRAHFRNGNVTIRLQDGFVWQGSTAKDILLTSYGDRRLAGRVTASISGTLQSTSEKCLAATGVDGTPPAGCTREVTRPVPVTIDFDLSVPPESATRQGDR
jgi:hypothetical protein